MIPQCLGLYLTSCTNRVGRLADTPSTTFYPTGRYTAKIINRHGRWRGLVSTDVLSRVVPLHIDGGKDYKLQRRTKYYYCNLDISMARRLLSVDRWVARYSTLQYEYRIHYKCSKKWRYHSAWLLTVRTVCMGPPRMVKQNMPEICWRHFRGCWGARLRGLPPAPPGLLSIAHKKCIDVVDLPRKQPTPVAVSSPPPHPTRRAFHSCMKREAGWESEINLRIILPPLLLPLSYILIYTHPSIFVPLV